MQFPAETTWLDLDDPTIDIQTGVWMPRGQVQKSIKQ